MENQIVIPEVCLMTLDQYQKQITPLLIEYEKFIKSNPKSLLKSGRGMIGYKTYHQLMDEATKIDESNQSKSLYATKMSAEKYSHMIQTNSENFLIKKSEFEYKIQLLFGEFADIFELSEIKKSNKRLIRLTYERNYYRYYLLNGFMTLQKLVEISTSVQMYPTKSLLQEFNDNIQIREELHPEIKEYIDKVMDDSLIKLTESNSKYLKRLLDKYESITDEDNKRKFSGYNPDLRKVLRNIESLPKVAKELAMNTVEPFRRKLYVKFSGIVKKEKIKSINFVGTIQNNVIKIDLTNNMAIQCFNKIVYNTSVLGNPYVQFPTTFLLQKDGSRGFHVSESQLKKSLI